jgi:hypothetical protein
MKYKTVIYSPTGWFASEKLWNNASYAFQHRNDVKFVPYGTLAAKHDFGDWKFLGNDYRKVCDQTGLAYNDLPKYDYEYMVIGE